MPFAKDMRSPIRKSQTAITFNSNHGRRQTGHVYVATKQPNSRRTKYDALLPA
jgi:hypothetical protein